MGIIEHDAAKTGCVFIGDEVSAAGLRLTGLRCLTPAPEQVRMAFEEACAAAGAVLITAEYAQHLPPALLAAALREQQPPTLVLADLREQTSPADLVAALKRQLGMAE